MSDDRPATLEDLRHLEERWKSHLNKLFDTREQWDEQRMRDHEDKERLMLKPIIQIVERMDKTLSSTDTTNLGLSFRVQSIESDLKNHKRGLLGFGAGTSISLVDLAKRIFFS